MALNSAELRQEFSFRTRQSHWEYLRSLRHPLNVLIIGGGIAGAGILRSLSLRGLPDIFLIEKNDFASSASGASSKLIHAGVRYLEVAWKNLKQGRLSDAWRDFCFVLSASRERRILRRMAPGLIISKPIYLVLGSEDKRHPLTVAAGLWLYYFIQIFQGQFYPPPFFSICKKRIGRLAPELDTQKIKAVLGFWDSETDDARLVMENLQDANDRGARIMNYVDLVSYKSTDFGVSVILQNRESGEDLTVHARVMINATGPFLDEVRRREIVSEGLVAATPKRVAPMIDRVAGSHLDVYPPVCDHSFYITAGDGRLVFVLRRAEDGLVYSRIGTTERPLAARESSDNIEPTPGEIDYLITLTRAYFPGAKLDESTIVRKDAGIRPLCTQSLDEPYNKSREHAIVRAGRVVHVAGVKLTDYRRVSHELMKTLPWKSWGVETKSVLSDSTPLRRGPAGPLYPEITISDFVQHTMVLHWCDYLLRRRGLAPMLASKRDPELLEKDHVRFQSLLKSRP